MNHVPSWLHDFQTSFSQVIKTPLVNLKNQLVVDPSIYECQSAWVRPSNYQNLKGNSSVELFRAGIGQYNRQYWMRIFTVLQKEIPLTCYLLGAWKFNQIVLNILGKNLEQKFLFPVNLDKLSAFFLSLLNLSIQEKTFVDLSLSELIKAALVHDEACLALLSSGIQESIDPYDSVDFNDTNMNCNTSNLQTFSDVLKSDDEFEAAQLVSNPCWVGTQENWNLTEISFLLRSQPHSLTADNAEKPSLQKFPKPVFRIFVLKGNTISQHLVSKPCFRFYELLKQKPIGMAIAETLIEFQDDDIEHELSLWLQDGFKLGLWKTG